MERKYGRNYSDLKEKVRIGNVQALGGNDSCQGIFLTFATRQLSTSLLRGLFLWSFKHEIAFISPNTTFNICCLSALPAGVADPKTSWSLEMIKINSVQLKSHMLFFSYLPTA